jgi:hypothetical protein
VGKGAIPRVQELGRKDMDVLVEFSRRVVKWWRKFRACYDELDRHVLALEAFLQDLNIDIDEGGPRR